MKKEIVKTEFIEYDKTLSGFVELRCLVLLGGQSSDENNH